MAHPPPASRCAYTTHTTAFRENNTLTKLKSLPEAQTLQDSA
jgi:hypothetical protein